jgi:hypothetical protein
MRNASRFVRVSAGLLGLVTLGWVLTGQAAKPAVRKISLATDWSHRHLIFTRPGTAEAATRASEDPRFWQQLYRREQRLKVPVAIAEPRGDLGGDLRQDYRGWRGFMRRRINFGNHKFHRDWSQGLGAGGVNRAGNYPAKFSFDIVNAHCASDPKPDYVVYGTSVPGFLGTQADIVAYDNLYSGCTSGTVPSVYWAYNTQGAVYTSPVISADGSQVAFVQTDGLAHGSLVLIKWVASATDSVTNPTTLASVIPALYHSCPALPCMAKFPLLNGATPTGDTTSSVFYDYTNDVAWVGDNAGLLHKFTGVFKSTPAEATAPWPLQVSTSAKPALTSAIYDRVSNLVFVEDQEGFLYSVTSTGSAVVKSAQLDFGAGFVEGPVVDSTNGLVYAFSSRDGTVLCPLGTGGTACTAVFQFPTAFAANSSGTEIVVGNSTTGLTPAPLYTGAFDSTYLNSVNATGNLYVCGNTANNPAVYQIPITAGAVPASGTAVAVLAGPLVGPPIPCSPMTDFANPNGTNGPAERLFVSVNNNGLSTNCASGGCTFDFIDTPWLATTTYAIGQQVLGSGLHIETATVGGISGGTVPVWTNNATDTITDGAVTWIDQGGIISNFSAWAANTLYGAHDRVLDSHGNVEIAINGGGTSGGTAPTWNTTIGANTTDGPVTWTNAGPVPTFALATSGGTGGIIVDNVANPTLFSGGSQVYFTTLTDGVCASGPSPGGCAVQASQSALQ